MVICRKRERRNGDGFVQTHCMHVWILNKMFKNKQSKNTSSSPVPGVVACACNSRTGKQGQVGPWGSLKSHSSLIGEVQANETPCLIGGRWCSRWLLLLFSSFYMHMCACSPTPKHTHMHMHTHVRTHMHLHNKETNCAWIRERAKSSEWIERKDIIC